MLSIAQHQLESVFAGRQLDTCLGLTRSEMKMGLVLWDRLVEIERFIYINLEMRMGGVLKIIARRGDNHVRQTETTPDPASNRCAVLRPNEIQNRVLWRRLSLSLGSARHKGQRCR